MMSWKLKGAICLMELKGINYRDKNLPLLYKFLLFSYDTSLLYDYFENESVTCYAMMHRYDYGTRNKDSLWLWNPSYLGLCYKSL